MDYESEEEEGGEDDAEDRPDQEEAEEQPASQNGDETSQDSLPDRRRVRRRTKTEDGEEEMDQMRVNAVLISSDAIEGYRYDSQRELWCEVSLTSFKASSRVLILLTLSY